MRSFQYKTFVDVPFKDIPFDELGAQGWELAAAVPSMLGGMTKYIFKKQDPEPIHPPQFGFGLRQDCWKWDGLTTAYEAEGEFDNNGL